MLKIRLDLSVGFPDPHPSTFTFFAGGWTRKCFPIFRHSLLPKAGISHALPSLFFFGMLICSTVLHPSSAYRAKKGWITAMTRWCGHGGGKGWQKMSRW